MDAARLGRAELARLEWVGYFGVAAAVDTVVGLRAFPAVLQGSLINADSYMRLVRLREMLAAHVPLHAVARDGSGTGTVLHWSHFLDSFLLLLAAPLAPVIGEARALHCVALAFGPISIGLLALSIAWATAPLTARRWRCLVPLLAVLSPEILGYAVPGVVHHHVPIAVASVTAAGFALRAPFDGAAAGRAMGATAAAGIWLTPECMPFLLAAFAGLGVYWVLHPESGRTGEALARAGVVFLALIAAALAVDPPMGGYGAVEIDRLSIVYLALAGAVCAIGLTLRWLDGRNLPPLRRAALGSLAALAGIALWLAAFPAIASGTDGILDAENTRLFFGNIAEMQPIASARDAVAFLTGGVLAALAAAALAVRARAPLWAYAALAISATVVLGLEHVRFSTYAEVAAVAMLPAILTALERTAAHCVVLALFLIAPWAAGVGALVPAEAKASAPESAAPCDPRMAADLLRPYGGQIVLADVNDTPGLLYWTRVLTVGSLYHHNVPAFLRLRAAWRSRPSATEPEEVRATGASLVLFCPGPERSLLVADVMRETLFDELNANRPPPWLVRAGAASGYVLYRVEPR